MEHHADPVDIATDHAEEARETALAELLAEPDSYAGPPFLYAGDGTTRLCWECQDAIPAERLAVRPNAAFCVECQTVLERFDQWSTP